MNFKTIYFFGFTFIKLLFKRIFMRKNQEILLRSEFLTEGIFSIDKRDRNVYNEFSRCINCGFCSVEAPSNSHYSRHPEFIFNSITTNLTDINALKSKFPEIKNFRCPVGAPYMELLNFIESSSKS